MGQGDSRYGHWESEAGLPVFVYDADEQVLPEAEWDPIGAPLTRRHWLAIGNRRITAVVANDGTAALLDEHDGLRFLVAPDPAGSGCSLVTEKATGARWGSAAADRSPASVPRRVFGPTWFRVEVAHDGLVLERTLICPEGELPWVLVRVCLTNEDDRPRRVTLAEEWALRPRFLNLGGTAESRRAVAEERVSYHVSEAVGAVRAVEEHTGVDERGFPAVFGSPVTIVLESPGAPTRPRAGGSTHPVLALEDDVDVPVGETVERWFRFGIDDGGTIDDPARLYRDSIEQAAARLPRARASAAPQAEREIPWHAAILSGGACADGLLGGHTLDQGSAYSFVMGFNGAARDPLQHALPLVYCEPDLALSVLRNTCAWAGPDGDLPYALDGAKRPWTSVWQPSDQNLWALWLAAEYAAATGDLAAFDADTPFHPAYRTDPVPLREHLRRQHRFFVDGVGLGEHGHVRIRNADWNDMAVLDSGVPHHEMVEQGESVLNSAMAAWVLPVWAGLCDRLGEKALSSEARGLADHLRKAVAGEWNGRWFRRAYGPGRGPIGDDDCWLEVQPWAILCGAASDEQARALLAHVDRHHRAGSPLGARVRWPVPDAPDLLGDRGEGTNAGVWFAVNMTLVWAASRFEPDLAWDEWRRMSLAAHTAAYPGVWEGTLSGPDCFNAPESPRAGRTWFAAAAGIGMQSFPVNNSHSHAQPLLAYLRLLGVEPTEQGTLRVGGPDAGATFESRTFELSSSGGRLEALGPVTVETPAGTVAGGPGDLRW